jgi:hypothetical protein
MIWLPILLWFADPWAGGASNNSQDLLCFPRTTHERRDYFRES